MLFDLINLQSSLSSVFRQWVSVIIVIIEALAILIIVTAIVAGTARYLARTLTKKDLSDKDAFRQYKNSLGKGLMLGLEVLIAADIILTVTIDLSLENILILGALIVVRTFLTWTLVLEKEERWPWQPRIHEED